MARLSLWPVLALAVVLLWPFPYVAPIRPPNELGRVYQARAMAQGRLDIDAEIARHGPLNDLSRYEGRTYPSRAPGTSLMGAAVLLAYGAATGRPVPAQSIAESLWVLEKVLLALPTLLMFVLLRRYLRRFSDNRWAVETAAIAWAFGSAALAYALVLFGHQLSALLLLGGFLAYDRARARGDGWVAVGALLHGTALLVEYTVAPAVAVLALWPLASAPRAPGGRLAPVLKRVGLGLAGAALPLALLAWYHAAAFEGPLDTAYQHLVQPGWRRVHEAGFLGIHWPRLDWLVRGLAEPGRGLLWFSPWVLVALVGFVPAWRRRRWGASAAAAVTLVYLWFSASWDPGTWGWVVGPRHLVPLLPFLTIPLSAALSRMRDRPGTAGPRWAGVGAGLVAAAVLVHAVTVVVYPHYPPELENPLWQLGLPLLVEGYTVDDVGKWILGTAHAWTVLPVLLAAGAAALAPALLAFGRPTPRGRVQALGAAALTAALWLGGSYLAGVLDGGPASAHADTRAWVRDHYDPRPGAPAPPPWRRGD